jgi:DNA polymerase III subunit alpha
MNFNNYISLHSHSHFSLQDGAQTLDQLCKKASDLGMSHLAITDHGRCGGLLQFKKTCEEYKLGFIPGFEPYLAPVSRHIKERDELYKSSSHLTLLAKNYKGLQNLFKLSSIGWIEGFYNKPRIDIESLIEYKEGLIVLSGCGSSFTSQMILEGRNEEAIRRMEILQSIFKDDFYIEIQNHGLEWQQILNKELKDISKRLSIPLVATQDSHYLNKEDAELHRNITRLAAGKLEFEGEESYFKSYDEFKSMFDKEDLHAIHRTNEIAAKCNVNWELGKTIWPVFDLPEGITPDKELKNKTILGLKRIGKNKDKIYIDRAKYELDVISKMGFSTYFLVVADFLQWAREHHISTGPGRGSCGGSLVCYCTEITEVDPIKYNLFFDRFLNYSRISLPDIDSDIDPNGRKNVIEYVYNKYGQEKCAQIGTYAEFKPRGSLRDFARVNGLPPSVGSDLAALVPPNVSGKTLTFDEAIEAEPKLLKTEYPHIVDLARKAEKIKNKAGVHAAGVVISNSDISLQVPLFLGKHKEIATQFDMHDVEEVGLVKYDFLGLKNLTIIQDTIDLVYKNHSVKINFKDISEEDQNVYKNIFQTGRLEGIFQFETSSGFRDLCIKVKPVSIEDLSAITALYRPGPLGMKDPETGKSMVDQYIDGRNGKEPNYLLPELKDILKETAGVLTFQEQLMKICIVLARYTPAEADNMRAIVGKKKIDKMREERTKFVDGCVKNKIDKTKAEQLFNNIEGFASYCFNAAHSIAYSIISYRTAWLKNYYPAEFYTALLNNSSKEESIKYIHACRKDNIIIVSPDINKSNTYFTNDGDTIIFGLSGIKGIGEKAANEIIEKRTFLNEINSLESLIKSEINKGIIIKLAESGALENISEMPREQLINNIEHLINYYKSLSNWEEREERIKQRDNEIEIWSINKNGPKPKKLPKNKEKPLFPDISKTVSLSLREKLKLENKTLGFYLSGHPLDEYNELLKNALYTINDIKEGLATHKERIKIPIVISSITEKRTKKGQNMAVIIIEDKTGIQEATIFPKTWTKIKGTIEEEKVYLLHGIIESISSEEEESKPIVSIIVDRIDKIEQGSNEVFPLEMTISDGSIWTFYPKEDQKTQEWQQACAIIDSLKRMGSIR